MLTASRRASFLQLVDVEDRHAASRLLADLGAQVVEERHDLEAFLPEARDSRRARGPRLPAPMIATRSLRSRPRIWRRCRFRSRT